MPWDPPIVTRSFTENGLPGHPEVRFRVGRGKLATPAAPQGNPYRESDPLTTVFGRAPAVEERKLCFRIGGQWDGVYMFFVIYIYTYYA